MRKKRKPKETGRIGNTLIALVAIVLALYGFVAYKAIQTTPSKQAKPGGQPIPAYYSRAEDAMPLPPTLDPAKFKGADIRAAYQVAKEIPEVLAQQPCYCYCERQGHRGLLDCFRTQHATTCTICIKEALLAGRMHHAGKTAEQIRAAIIQGQWADVGSSS